MNKILEKLRGFFFLNTISELAHHLKNKPKYQALQNLSPKIIIRLDCDDFLALNKKNTINHVSFLDYLNFSFLSIPSVKKKLNFVMEIMKKDTEVLKRLSDDDKLRFFHVLLDHNLGNTYVFYKLFNEEVLNLENIESIQLIDRFLSNLMINKLKIFHLKLTNPIIQFLFEIIENNMDLLDDKMCLVLLQINLKLRVLNLILANDTLEQKYLNQIETRLHDLLISDNLSNEPDFLSEVMFYFAKLSYLIKHQNLVDYFENNLLIRFQHLNASQTYRTLIFFLSYNSKNDIKKKKFLDIFYIKYMRGTSFYFKEYLNRVMNIKKLEFNIFKNLGLIFTRFFLSSIRTSQPKYLKDFHFDLFQLGDLINFCGKEESFNLSNIMIILRKHIFQKVKYMYEYKFRKNMNMEYKLHDFWIKILEFYDFQLESYSHIIDDPEATLLLNMAVHYSILNLKRFHLDELIILYGVIDKRISCTTISIEAKKLAILKIFADQKCLEYLKDKLIPKFYIINQPMIMTKALEQGLRLYENKMIDLNIIIDYLKEMIENLKNYENDIIINILKLVEKINLKVEAFEKCKELIEELIDENIVTLLIKNLDILLTSLKLFLDFYCYNLQKYGQILPGQCINLVEKMSQSLNLLIRKLLFIDSDQINENCLTTFLMILKLIEEKYIKVQHSIAKEFETLSKFCLRFIADRYKKFSYEGLEKILKAAFQMKAALEKFDDGSGLYDKTLIQEIDPYIEDNLRRFSDDFRKEWKKLKIRISSN